MGSRGAFIDVNKGDFAFTENGQRYEILGAFDGIEVITRPHDSVKAPEYSHSACRIYAVIQDGKLKHLAFYDENHRQVKVIDFFHKHGYNRIKPHVHFNLQHIKNEAGTPPSEEDLKLIDKLKKGLNLE